MTIGDEISETVDRIVTAGEKLERQRRRILGPFDQIEPSEPSANAEARSKQGDMNRYPWIAGE